MAAATNRYDNGSTVQRCASVFASISSLPLPRRTRLAAAPSGWLRVDRGRFIYDLPTREEGIGACVWACRRSMYVHVHIRCSACTLVSPRQRPFTQGGEALMSFNIVD